jgi:two-component system cell cycle sensor histidine kinase/response regulator CckA
MKRAQTVLLVEDEPISRKFMSSMLKDNGYFVLEAANGKAAMDAGARHHGRIHILITDIILTGPMDGAELSLEMRRGRPDLKTVYVSAYPSDMVDTPDRQGMESDSEFFLPKPFTPKHFLAMMEECASSPTPAG